MTEPSPYAEPWVVESPEDCHFYHTMEIPGLGLFEGHVDLRGGAEAYLGGVDPKGLRVLEVGPANGFLSFHLEARGAAEVVALEVDDATIWDAVPQPDLDMPAILADRKTHMDKIKRAFWLAHGALNSRVKVVYGDARQPPPGLGRFDLVVLGGVLLHCRDCLGALSACAALSDGAIVVTEQFLHPLTERADEPLLWLAPSRENRIWDVWWRFTPGWVAQVLPLLGFPEVRVSLHDQMSLGKGYRHFSVWGKR